MNGVTDADVRVSVGAWRPWTGGECPVPGETMVQVRAGLGREAFSGPARDFTWAWGVSMCDEITEYRVLSQAPVARSSRMCACAPGKCVASEDGKARGRVSVISDLVCRECVPAPTPPRLVLLEDEVTAASLLEEAARIQAERALEYDSVEGGERSMAATVDAFNSITGRDVTESEGWMFMVLLKLVRDRSVDGGHEDSCKDAVSYAALMGEARLGGR